MKLTGDAFTYVWDDLLWLLQIFRYNVITRTEHGWESSEQVQAGEAVDMERERPPFIIDPNGRLRKVIIPGFVKDTLSWMGLPTVYGDTWVSSGGKTVEEEKAEALACYHLEPATDRDCDFDCDSDSSYQVPSDDSSSDDSDFSMYDDDDDDDDGSGESMDMNVGAGM